MDERVRVSVEAANNLAGGLNSSAAAIDGWARRIETGPIGRLQGSIGRLSGAFGAIAGVSFVFREIKGGLSDALEAERILNRLTHAVEMTGKSFTEEGPRIEAAVKKIFDTTRFDDEDARAALARLIAMTGNYEQSLRALDVAADMAAVSGGDLASSAQQLGMVAAGAGRAFKQFGIDLTDAEEKAFQLTDEFHRMEFALFKFREIHGTALDEMKGKYGALIRFQKDWKEALEQFGDTSAKELYAIQQYFDNIGTAIRRAAEDWGILTRAIGQFTPGGGTARGRGASGTWEVKPPDMPPAAPDTKAAEAYAAALDALVNRGEAWEKQQRLLADAIEIVDQKTGKAGAGADAFERQLRDVQDAASATGAEIDIRLIPALQRLYDLERRQQIGSEFSAIGRTLPGARQIAPTPYSSQYLDEQFARNRLFGPEGTHNVALKVIVPEVKLTPSAMRDLGVQFGQAISPGLSDALSDVALTGGRNLGDIMGRAFEERVRAGSEQFVGALGSIFADLFGGGSQNIVERNGRFFIEGGTNPPGGFASAEEAFPNSNQGRAAGAIGTGLAFAQIGIGAFQSGRTDQSTLLGGTLGGAAAGFGAGGWVGAIVGAVVGFIGTLLGQQELHDSYPYARFGIRGGEAFFEAAPGEEGAFRNIPENRQEEALARLRQTWEDFYAGYFGILMTFPDQLAEGVLADLGDITPRIGLDQGGDIGGGASANFWKHYDEYLRSGMPDQIAAAFFDDLSDAFQRYGMSEGRFAQIFADLDQLDPRKQMELLGMLAQAVVDFFETIAYFRTPAFQEMGPGDFAPSAGPPGMLMQAQTRMHESFADTLAREDQELIRLGSTLDELTGEAQIRNAARLGELMRQRQEEMENFWRRMAQAMENVNASLDAFALDIDLQQLVTPEGEPDYEARIARLQTEGENVWNRLMTATTPEEIEHWTNEWIRINQQILGLAQNLGPDAYQQFLSWIEENNQRFRTDVGDRFRQIGQDVQDANDAFLAAIQGFIDAFLDATGQIDRDENLLNIGRYKRDKEGNLIVIPPRPVPPDQINIGPEQAAWIQSSSESLTEIAGYNSQIVAELVAIRAQLEANDGGASAQSVSVKVGGVLRVEDSEGGYIRDVQLRRLN